MTEEVVTVNGYSHSLETSSPILKSATKTTESWNGNIETEISNVVITSSEKVTVESPPQKSQRAGVANKGPNQILPSNDLWTSKAGGCVKIRATEESLKNEPPISVPGLLQQAAKLFPNRVALASKNKDGSWNEVQYKDYYENVRVVAKAFIHLGLDRYNSVGIIGFNSAEWFYSDLGAIFAGGFAAGMYTTNSAEACLFCLESSNANICVVEDEKQLQKILEIKHKLPLLKTIIQYSGEPKAPGVLSWSDVMKIGKEQSDDKLDAVLKTIAVNECCTLVYTSGTEGKSKAVMLSHDNLTWDAASIVKHINLSDEKGEVVVSYLPLSHVAAQVIDIYCVISIGAKVVFADKDALKGSLKFTLVDARPTVFLGVPRVWEKMQEALLSIGKQSGGLKKTIANWAKIASLQHHESSVISGSNASESYRYKFYRWLIFDRIKQRMGLDRCRYFISAAAPISQDVKKYFMSLDILLLEAFGMSECAGAHTIGLYSNYSLTGVGLTLPGAETKLFMKDDQEEICMRGRHVFMGYLDEPEKTKQTLDEDGWLHSGDIGHIDENGHLHITGRSKELLITAGGENIAPVLIEQTLKNELPVISNAMLIGDKRKFLSVLITLKTEVDSEGRPIDKLVKDVKAWCELLGTSCDTLSDVLNEPKKLKQVRDGIQEAIDKANKKAVSRAQNIQKFAILPVDFTVGDELGPTLKVKRPVVYKKYADVIEEFYKET